MSMSPAFIFLLLAAMVVFYFSMERYQNRPDVSGLLGLFGGLWALFGVFLIPAGTVGFSYFIVTVLLLGGALLLPLVLPEKTRKELDRKLKPVHDMLKGLPELPSANRFVLRNARKMESLRKTDDRLLVAFFVIFSVAILYMAFFMSAVEPAEPGDRNSFIETDDEGPIRPLPYTYKKEYTRGDAYVAIITIRSVPLSTDILSKGVDRAKPEVEDYIEEKFGGTAKVTGDGEDEMEFNGHDGIRKKYDVEWTNNFGQTVEGKMRIDVWYCHQNLKLVAVAYFYPNDPNYLEDATQDLVDSIECH